MSNEAKLSGLRARHRVRTAERRERDKAILELFAQKDRQLGKDLARILSVDIITIRRAIDRLRATGHRIGGARGYGYVYFGGPK